MAVKNILTQGNPILKKKAKAVKIVTVKHRKLIDDMIETMLSAPGVGLAAPQVGVSERIIVAKVHDKTYALINPKIIRKFGKQTCMEGCLSVPGMEAPVERYESITVKALDRKGESVTIEANKLLAVVFQHEIDHLDGILFIERVKDPSLIKLKNPDKDETI